jgi:hypothetical protein
VRSCILCNAVSNMSQRRRPHHSRHQGKVLDGILVAVSRLTRESVQVGFLERIHGHCRGRTALDKVLP